MQDDRLKLPRSSYEELCKIIKAYGHMTEPASLDEISRLCAMNKTAITANNSFLANIGLIEGGQAKSATSKGDALSKALEHEIPDQIQRKAGLASSAKMISWERWLPQSKFEERWRVQHWNRTSLTPREKRSRQRL